MSGDLASRAEAALEAMVCDIDAPGAPGGIAALVVNGQVQACRATGMVHPPRAEPWTRSSRARIASLSKPMAAQVILALCRDGVLDLEAPAAEYLGSTPQTLGQISLRQLLSMQSGLLDEFPLCYLATGSGAADHHTLDQRLSLIARQTALNHQPGARTVYTNTAYTLLQRIAERATGTGFEALLREIVFGPADMAQAGLPAQGYGFAPGEGLGCSVADGVWTPLEYWPEATAASGVTASLDDLLAWHAWNHGGGAALWNLACQAQNHSDGSVSGYALGVERKSLCDHVTVGHAGGLAGWAADYVCLPDLNAAIIVLANRIDVNWYERGREALVTMLELDPDPAATPRLIASDPPKHDWSADFGDPVSGTALRLSGGGDEINFEGRRVIRQPAGDFVRSLGPEPIRLQIGDNRDGPPAEIHVTEGNLHRRYHLATCDAGPCQPLEGVYTTDALPGQLAIAELDGELRLGVGQAWPQARPLWLRPILKGVWRAFGPAPDAPAGLHLHWPDPNRDPDDLRVCMTRLEGYRYRRTGDAAAARAALEWAMPCPLSTDLPEGDRP